MRFTKEPLPEPKHGDTREVRKFFLFPKTLMGTTVWLEEATVIQVFCLPDGDIIPGFGDLEAGWNDGKFKPEEVIHKIIGDTK